MCLKTLKFRLFPTKKQISNLESTLEVCREVYNNLVNERTALFEITGSSPNYHDQAVAITAWKKEHPELKLVHSQVLQNVAVRVDLAFQAFFRRVKRGETPGYPRLKGKGSYDSFCFPQSGFKLGESTISISLLKKQTQIKAKIHRPVSGKIKTLTIRRYGDKWYATLTVDQESETVLKSDLKIGIDLGLKSFAAFSNGEFIENPRFFRKDEKALAKAQRKFDKVKHQYRSKVRKKSKKVVSRIHERIRNRRHDFCHQESRKIVNRFGVIVLEDLKVKNMLGNHNLAKSISDASWSQFRSLITSKAESAGRKIVFVNPAYTSQDCHQCGYRAKKKLSDRWHLCPICGASLDRDTNAAINILNLGLRT